MSLLEVARRQVKKCDLTSKIAYSVFINTVTQTVEGDPDAYIEIHGAANEKIFYLFVRGAYIGFCEPTNPPDLDEVTAIVSFQGTIASPVANFAADSGYVNSFSALVADPNSITVPNDYTLFMFTCQKPDTGHCFVPSTGVYITIEIAQLFMGTVSTVS